MPTEEELQMYQNIPQENQEEDEDSNDEEQTEQSQSNESGEPAAKRKAPNNSKSIAEKEFKPTPIVNEIAVDEEEISSREQSASETNDAS